MDDCKRKTAFRLWREQCNLEVEEAAALLGLTSQMIVYLDRGYSAIDRPAVPRPATRMLMSAISRGIVLEPWPLVA